MPQDRNGTEASVLLESLERGKAFCISVLQDDIIDLDVSDVNRLLSEMVLELSFVCYHLRFTRGMCSAAFCQWATVMSDLEKSLCATRTDVSERTRVCDRLNISFSTSASDFAPLEATDLWHKPWSVRFRRPDLNSIIAFPNPAPKPRYLSISAVMK